MNEIPHNVSAAISWLRFPLMFGVVLIHSGISAGEGYPTLDFIVRLFTQSLPAFCVHALPLIIIGKVASALLAGKPEWLWIADYMINPVLITAAAVGSYMILKAAAPRLTSIITGGR